MSRVIYIPFGTDHETILSKAQRLAEEDHEEYYLHWHGVATSCVDCTVWDSTKPIPRGRCFHYKPKGGVNGAVATV